MPGLRQPLPNRTRTRLAALCGFVLTFLALLAASASAAQNRASWTLDDILKRLDEEAKRFRGLTASLERTKVTVVVNDRSTESGQIYVRRDDKMLLELSVPEERTILRTGDDLYIFHPRTKRLEQYDLGKHRALVDEYLLLGFGTSGNDLKRGFLVTILGEPSLGGRRVVLLELTPKSEQVRQQISKVHLWIDQATWLPVQQKFFETGSGDYFEIRYSQIVRNPSLPDSRFKPRWPKGITRVRPQA